MHECICMYYTCVCTSTVHCLCTHIHIYAYVFGGYTHVCRHIHKWSVLCAYVFMNSHVDMYNAWKPNGYTDYYVCNFCICVCTIMYVCVSTL